MSVRRHVDLFSGGLLPTATSTNTEGRNTRYAQGGTPLAVALRGRPPYPLPTITAADGSRSSGVMMRGEGNPTLSGALKTLYPTVTVHGLHNNHGSNPKSGNGLSTALKKQILPTVTCSTHTGPGGHKNEGGKNLQTALNGQVNPRWALWFMGYPVEWFD